MKLYFNEHKKQQSSLDLDLFYRDNLIIQKDLVLV